MSKIRKKHLQHSKSFKKEVNSVNNNLTFTAFRIFDEVWLVGKYKGIELNNTPAHYLKWAYENMRLSDTLKSILKSKIK
jgi:hypothetical protein